MGWSYGWAGMMNGFDGFGGFWGVLSMLIFWVLVIWAIIALVRWAGWRQWHRGDRLAEQSPLDVIKMRYAKGEIDKKEFEEKKKDLG